jgi:hypothetical protein
MIRIIFLCFLLLGATLGDAIGECPAEGRIGDSPNELKDVIKNKLVCGTAITGNDKWQEEHRPNGDLWERAKGPEDPVDPSHLVGTWHIENRGGTTGNERDDWVCYEYSGGDTFCFRLYEIGEDKYSFCDESGNPVATAVFYNRSAADGICGF